MTIQEVYEQAQKLSPEERKDLAKLLLDSLPLAEDEVQAKRKAALREFIAMAKDLQTQFKEDYGHLSEEEQEKLIQEWIEEA